jgi:hypothetical protein
VGVSPLQLVNLHRNRRYFVIKLHTWFWSIIFLEDKHKMLLHLSIFYEYQQFFQHRICFSIQPPDYSDPWPRLARSSSFFLIMLFKKWSITCQTPNMALGQTFDINSNTNTQNTHLSRHLQNTFYPAGYVLDISLDGTTLPVLKNPQSVYVCK